MLDLAQVMPGHHGQTATSPAASDTLSSLKPTHSQDQMVTEMRCILYRFPREIRDKIYHAAENYQHWRYQQYKKHHWKICLELLIALGPDPVLYDEALEMYHSMQTIDYRNIDWFMEAASHRVVEKFRYLLIQYEEYLSCMQDNSLLLKLANAPPLQMLEVTVFNSYNHEEGDALFRFLYNITSRLSGFRTFKFRYPYSFGGSRDSFDSIWGIVIERLNEIFSQTGRLETVFEGNEDEYGYDRWISEEAWFWEAEVGGYLRMEVGHEWMGINHESAAVHASWT